ncbi:hypothetical protein B6U91_00575 [Candidatus Pacearchaeota archaeon ex4484_71]|nr:MAG: hypothetical protein B6U91_00575 [Candidatus Pacearchaeota archaeon ex4484_71]
MKKRLRKTITIVLILAFILVPFFIIKTGITGNFIKKYENQEYSYTKAICVEDNYCEDYKIICEGNKLIKMTPTGFGIKKYEGITAQKYEEAIGKLCD